MNVTKHLKDRFVNLDLHRFLIDDENSIASALLYNLSGKICGFQQYRVGADKKPNNDPEKADTTPTKPKAPWLYLE